jgi:gamma-glutamylcyclotransferase (GGCT)/AIG2-like uncharacterized protein YtfP
MKKSLYVAYGSNLNLSQMKYRCPQARLIGTGEIKDFELQFKGNPFSAFATISPSKGGSVPVGVWEITPQDEWALDRYEGYPTHYFKQTVPVEMGDKSVKAMVYIMDLRREFGMPSTSYYATVARGYADCGLDRNVLDEAVEKSTREYYRSVLGSEEEVFDDDEDEDFCEEEEEGEDDAWQLSL